MHHCTICSILWLIVSVFIGCSFNFYPPLAQCSHSGWSLMFCYWATGSTYSSKVFVYLVLGIHLVSAGVIWFRFVQDTQTKWMPVSSRSLPRLPPDQSNVGDRQLRTKVPLLVVGIKCWSGIWREIDLVTELPYS